VSTIAEGQGLNITVQSYPRYARLSVSCRAASSCPTCGDLTDMIVDDLEHLCKVAGVDTPVTLVD